MPAAEGRDLASRFIAAEKYDLPDRGTSDDLAGGFFTALHDFKNPAGEPRAAKEPPD
jgi:hypothetical protein